MQKMLVLLNNLDAESQIPRLREIAGTHGIAKAYLARLSPDFGSRVRSIVAPHKLDMAARMSDTATDRYLSLIADALREAGLDCETVSMGIAATALDDFIKNNGIDLVMTSDGRSGLCSWLPSGGLFRREVQLLQDHAFTDKATGSARDDGDPPGVKKMLVLLNRPDIEDLLPDLRDMFLSQEVDTVYVASVSHNPALVVAPLQELPMRERLVVYLARVSHAFGSRVRSRVAPDKLDMAARMGNGAATKYLSRIAGALSAQGVEAIPIGVGIPADKVEEYVRGNGIDVVVSGDRRSGLRCWTVASLAGRGTESLYFGLAEEMVAPQRRAKARYAATRISDYVLQFGFLLSFWLVLSGKYQLKYVLFGVASAALVTLLTNGSFSAAFRHAGASYSLTQPVTRFVRFLGYLPWLFYQILLANIQVARIVLDPRMPVEPVLLQFSTRMKRELAQVILATSITLTPGTVTISLDSGRYTIHALVRASAEDLAKAGMQNRVGGIFMEKKEQPPRVLWAYSMGELAH